MILLVSGQVGAAIISSNDSVFGVDSVTQDSESGLDWLDVTLSINRSFLGGLPLNSVIRKATKRRKVFPTDDSAKKVIYLAIQEASKKWTMPIRNWKDALNRFMILFENHMAEFI